MNLHLSPCSLWSNIYKVLFALIELTAVTSFFELQFIGFVGNSEPVAIDDELH